MIKKLFGIWVRREACRLASHAVQEPECPSLWSLCVFFESYILLGAEATQADFGPKEPVTLNEVRNDQETHS